MSHPTWSVRDLFAMAYLDGLNRMARAAQGTVDRLDGIARGAEDDQRDRILLGQTASRSIAQK